MLYAVLALLTVAAAPRPEVSVRDSAVAAYEVRVLRLRPLAVSVTAELPMDGRALLMATTRPGDIPELNARGWPALVAELAVRDSAGQRLELRSAGPAGWQLAERYKGRVAVSYVVDYAPAAGRGWPAPRELAYADTAGATVVTRSLFVTTERTGAVRVHFAPPAGWHVTTPWRPVAGREATFLVEGVPALTENIVALGRGRPLVEQAGRLRVLVTTFGPWRAARPLVAGVLDPVVLRFVRRMGLRDSAYYHVVLLPQLESGGESYRASFALSFDSVPTAANRDRWGNTIAHELFHQWNGWRLQGADYPSSQWFQEGFTEYEANLALLVTGLDGPEAFRRKLAQHVANYGRLQTTLAAPGTHKGPPLYSAGALVAFSWDVMIRRATKGAHDLGDFWRALLRRTGDGSRPYSWPDIEAALSATAPGDWNAFYATYVQGGSALPLDRSFALAGLRLEQPAGTGPRVVLDPAASPQARALWRSMMRRDRARPARAWLDRRARGQVSRTPSVRDVLRGPLVASAIDIRLPTDAQSCSCDRSRASVQRLVRHGRSSRQVECLGRIERLGAPGREKMGGVARCRAGRSWGGGDREHRSRRFAAAPSRSWP